MQKLYCYVDETGQDTKGALFIVSVVIAENERASLIKQLETIERASGKGRRKWIHTRRKARATYIRDVLDAPEFKGKLNYAIYRTATDYLPRTVLTAARAITAYTEGGYKATVFIDGLPKSQTRWFGTELRHLRIRTGKVRGVRKEGADALMRLADALCGFVRAALAGQAEMKRLLESGERKGYVKEL